MKDHIPYQNRLNRLPDFVVEYSIELADELTEAKPHQGMRVDFAYEGDDLQKDGVHMIWPELLDQNDHVILDTRPEAIEYKGKANMWIISDERREYHRARLRLGTKGIWWRGGRVAYVTVVEINLS